MKNKSLLKITLLGMLFIFAISLNTFSQEAKCMKEKQTEQVETKAAGCDKTAATEAQKASKCASTETAAKSSDCKSNMTEKQGEKACAKDTEKAEAIQPEKTDKK
jgi:hypothetical protein